MNIGIYLENYRRGGVDRVIVDTVTYWPKPQDKFFIFVNDTHQGLEWIRESLPKARVIPYPTPLGMRSSVQPSLIQRFWYDVAGCYLAMWFQKMRVRYLIEDYCIDALYVHNGGWPGARSTRSAVLAAYDMRIECVLVIHNFVSKHWAIRLQEAWLEKQLSRTGLTVVAVSECCLRSIQENTHLAPGRLIPSAS